MATSTNWFAMIQPMPPATAIETRTVVRTDTSAADAQPLEKRHHRSQYKRQSESKCEGDQNLARKVQCRDRSDQDNGSRITPELGPCSEPCGRQVVFHR